jgi:N utilization substance protein A
VDIINWSPDIRVFVENALKPAKLAQVNVNEKDKSLDIRVTDDQHSLSIGKKGQNVRLAMRLTGWKISISKLEKEADNAQNEFVRRINQAIQELMQITGVDEATSEILVGNGFHSREGLKEASVETLAGIEGITRETAEAIYAAVHAGE